MSGSFLVRLLSVVPGVAITFLVAAQEPSGFTQFFLNPYALNPSYAGIDGQPALSVLYRKQWMNIDGAPTIANAALHTPVNDRLGAGISIVNDSKGFFNNSSLLLSVAYRVALQPHTHLRFGLSAGGSWNTVDMKKLEGVNDPALVAVLDQNASLAGNAGLSLQHHFFNAGISLPTLFAPSYVSEDPFNIREVKPFQVLTFNAGHRFYFNHDRNIFEPYLLYHVNRGLPAQLEVAGVVHLDHAVWVGASYREAFGISALGGVKLKNAFAIGGSYSIGRRGINELNSPTFEIGLSYLFGKRRRSIPAYSFVNDVKPRERKPGAIPARGVAAAREQDTAQPKKAPGKTDPVSDSNQQEAPNPTTEIVEVHENGKRDASDGKHAPLETVEPEAVEKPDVPDGKVTNHARKPERIPDNAPAKFIRPETARAEADTHVEKPEREQRTRVTGVGDDTQRIYSTRPVVATPARHETVTKGDHPEELAISNYVVVGTFKARDNAYHFSEGLQNLNYKSAVGFVTEKNLWIVYILKSRDLARAQAEQARVGRIFILKDAWLLTVEAEP